MYASTQKTAKFSGTVWRSQSPAVCGGRRAIVPNHRAVHSEYRQWCSSKLILDHQESRCRLFYGKDVSLDHPRSGVVYNFGRVCLYVCMYVYQTITFESVGVGNSFFCMRYISTDYWSSSYMKVIESRSRSQEQKGRKFLFPQCKTSIGNNSRSVTHRTVMFACCMGFSCTVDRMV